MYVVTYMRVCGCRTRRARRRRCDRLLLQRRWRRHVLASGIVVGDGCGDGQSVADFGVRAVPMELLLWLGMALRADRAPCADSLGQRHQRRRCCVLDVWMYSMFVSRYVSISPVGGLACILTAVVACEQFWLTRAHKLATIYMVNLTDDNQWHACSARSPEGGSLCLDANISALLPPRIPPRDKLPGATNPSPEHVHTRTRDTATENIHRKVERDA